MEDLHQVCCQHGREQPSPRYPSITKAHSQTEHTLGIMQGSWLISVEIAGVLEMGLRYTYHLQGRQTTHTSSVGDLTLYSTFSACTFLHIHHQWKISMSHSNAARSLWQDVISAVLLTPDLIFLRISDDENSSPWCGAIPF